MPAGNWVQQQQTSLRRNNAGASSCCVVAAAVKRGAKECNVDLAATPRRDGRHLYL